MFIGRKAIRRRNLGRGRASRLPRAADLRERPGVSPATLMRWLRVLEALALDAASSRGLSVARTAIVDTASHYFLESERFDRVGIRGRIAVMTLAAAHDDPADPWARAAVLLKSAGRLWDDARTAARKFWQRASDDARVSDAVRRFSAANANALTN